MDAWKPAVLGIAVFLVLGTAIVARVVRTQDASATTRPAAANVRTGRVGP